MRARVIWGKDTYGPKNTGNTRERDLQTNVKINTVNPGKRYLRTKEDTIIWRKDGRKNKRQQALVRREMSAVVRSVEIFKTKEEKKGRRSLLKKKQRPQRYVECTIVKRSLLWITLSTISR